MVSFIISFNGFSQSFLYDGGSVVEDEAMAVSKDANGNIYTTGYFGGYCQFSDIISLTSAGASDIFIMKSFPSGQVDWVKSAGGYGNDWGVSIITDDLGNSYVTGYFYATADFGTQTLTSAGGQDIFIAKYDSTGNLIWAVQAGGNGLDISNNITLDNIGNIIVTGQFVGTSTFGTTTITSLIDPQTSQYVMNSFVAKYDTIGNFIWVKQGMSDKNCRGISVTTDDVGNIYSTGQYSDTLQFDNIHYNDIFNSIYLIKFNAAGNEQWFKKIGGSINNMAYDITTDNSNHILLTGEVHGALHFYDNSNYVLTNTYDYQVFVAKFNTIGDLLWAISDGSESDVSSKTVCVNNLDEIFIAGDFKCRFSEYADVYGQGTFNSVGYDDVFITKYDENGQRQWMRNFGGKKEDHLHGMVISDNKPVMVGSFNNVLVMPIGGGLVNNNHEVNYNYSIFEVNGGVPYCGYNTYWNFSELESYGSSDIFILNAINPNRPPYDYYKRTGTGCDRPYVGCCIGDDYSVDDMCVNPIEGCGDVDLVACTNTSSAYNYNFPLYSQCPNFTYHWSTGSNSKLFSVDTSGFYFVTVTSEDGCFQSSDSVEAIVHPLPEVPWISDNLGFGTNSPVPYTIFACADSVVLTGSNITTQEFYWTPGFPQNDSVITVYNSGYYTFYVIDSNGCVSSNYVYVYLEQGSFPVVEPYLLDVTDSISNDTIFVCENQQITIHMFDFISDSPHLAPCNSVLHGDHNWSVASSLPTNNCGSYCNCAMFTVDTSDYYHFTDTLIRDNLCDSDTVVANITYYVQVMPTPEVHLDIFGAENFCPGDSVLLSVCCADDYHWYASGGGTFSGSPYNDSILVWLPGSYYVWGKVTNSYGCKDSMIIAYSVNYWSSPPITMVPSNGLICPNDSVSLTINMDSIIDYEWFGPMGQIPNDSSTIFVNTAGYYNCIVTFTDSCRVSSNTVEVKQYVTPFLTVSPNTLICYGDSAQICLTTNPGSNYSWGPPISNSNLCQLVIDSGTYSCQVSSCGITTNLSTTIEVDYPVISITSLGPTAFCQGDSVQLLADNSEMSLYNWMPNGEEDTIITVYSPGDYHLMVVDANGCSATSNIITVTVNSSQSPIVENDTICVGQVATLIATGAENYNWVVSDTETVPFLMDSVFTTPALFDDTTFYVFSTVPPCYSDFVPVSVIVLDSVASLTPQLFSNTPLCENETIQISGIAPSRSIYHWSGPLGFSSTDSVLVLPGISSQYSGTFSLYIENDGCLSYQSSISVIIYPLPQTNVINDTAICVGDEIQLNATGNYAFHWEPDVGINNVSISNPIVSPDSDITYYCIVTDNNGCVDTAFVNIQVHRHPFSTLIQLDTTIVIGESVPLNIYSDSSNLIFDWFPNYNISCTVCKDPIATPQETTEYQAYYEDSIGCRFDVIDYVITVSYEYSLDVPSVFTPNGDGKNDVVYVKGWGIKDLLEFSIYNRWGQRIFYSEDKNVGWDGTYKGKLQNIDSYTYYVRVRFYNNIERDKKGTINLMK